MSSFYNPEIKLTVVCNGDSQVIEVTDTFRVSFLKDNIKNEFRLASTKAFYLECNGNKMATKRQIKKYAQDGDTILVHIR